VGNRARVGGIPRRPSIVAEEREQQLPIEVLVERTPHATYYVTQGVFSRYVGVVESRTSDGWLLDVIFDTMDIRRSSAETVLVIGVVPRAASSVAALRANLPDGTTVA
jgi:hypothetical protein